MKAVMIILFFVCLMAACGNVFAGNDSHAVLFTDKLLNGRFLSGLDDASATVFIQGVIDGIGKTSPGALGKICPGKSREDLVLAVKQYYLNNPDKIDRAVAEVMMSGEI